MGRLHQSVGGAFEALIRLTANRHDDAITLVRQHVEGRFVSGGEFVPVGNAWPDWLGYVGRRRAIAFDAKSVTGDAFRAPSDRMHQFLRLRELAAKHGVFSFYLVEWRDVAPVEYEVFPVRPADKWPFVRQRGEGVAFKDLSGMWEWLKSGELSPELGREQEGIHVLD